MGSNIDGCRPRIAARVVLMVLCASAALVGCQQAPPRLAGVVNPDPHRSQRLLAMAAQEAAMIADLDARLTRQLNLADSQIQQGWVADARTTLGGARQTLMLPEATTKLGSHARISGWISISELSRQIGDPAGAITACEGAVAAMMALESPARRCDYVMGIANELQYLKGAAAAAELLAKAGPWTRSIDNVAQRRQAVVSFASALFNLDAYDAGQQMLRQEDDAAWRSDTLALLATRAGAANARGTLDMATPAPGSSAGQVFYGRQLKYKDVFQGQTNSKSMKD